MARCRHQIMRNEPNEIITIALSSTYGSRIDEDISLYAPWSDQRINQKTPKRTQSNLDLAHLVFSPAFNYLPHPTYRFRKPPTNRPTRRQFAGSPVSGRLISDGHRSTRKDQDRFGLQDSRKRYWFAGSTDRSAHQADQRFETAFRLAQEGSLLAARSAQARQSSKPVIEVSHPGRSSTLSGDHRTARTEKVTSALAQGTKRFVPCAVSHVPVLHSRLSAFTGPVS